MSEKWELSPEQIEWILGRLKAFPDDKVSLMAFGNGVAHAASLKAREDTLKELFREIEKLVAYSGDDATFMTMNRHQYEWLKNKMSAALKAGKTV